MLTDRGQPCFATARAHWPLVESIQAVRAVVATHTHTQQEDVTRQSHAAAQARHRHYTLALTDLRAASPEPSRGVVGKRRRTVPCTYAPGGTAADAQCTVRTFHLNLSAILAKNGAKLSWSKGCNFVRFLSVTKRGLNLCALSQLIPPSLLVTQTSLTR
jgi:hypothetical protein